MVSEIIQEAIQKIKIRHLLKKAASDSRFYPRDGKTFCGQMISTYLYENSYDVTSILIPGMALIKYKIDYTNTTKMYDIVRENNGYGVKIISRYMASIYCNKTLVVALSQYAKPYNHAAFIYPTYTPYNDVDGPMVAQAGGVCGVMRMSNKNAWGDTWRDPRIIYFVLDRSNIDGLWKI